SNLEKAGYTLIFITHDKDRQFETREGLKYDKTTLSLGGRVRDLILNMVDFVVFVELGKESVKGKTVDKRYIYFRGDSGLEAGSRFTHVPNKIEYDFKGFLDTVENAILAEYGGDQKAVNEAKSEQEKKQKAKAKEFVEEASSTKVASDYIEEINELIQNMENTDKKKVVAFTSAEFGIKDFRKIEEIESLKEVLEHVKSITETK